MGNSPVQADWRPMSFYRFEEVIGASVAGGQYDERRQNSSAFIVLSPD
jgi:hypothetical protein